ncbi:unnamed protein product [Rotaria sordida]|uniref:CUB domain-containing protein n=1 Tax=Rotaria sordida TaxID=392033 RepID=A0A813S3C7_9BILA|nr:unnamed protein product [Rotaria sordida]CAF0788952.1 unnamed protein product [Rotaria sordida]CAF3474107.1 unnamed protein product [Rotaria sordida]CAF3532746.1 unnamed protein product [Rotaria sordida]
MLLVLVFYLPSLVLARIGHSKQSYCLDEVKSGTLSLGCPNNQLIKLGRIIYGYSWSNDCSYIDKDCTMDVPHEDVICLTTTNCTIRVVEHPLILQDCWNLAASYIQAEFECIAEYSLQNVCQPQDTTLTYGFLSTPNYPHGFSSNLNCPCALFASPGHAIVLEVIDFRLPTCAEAGLILWLGQDFQTKCLTQDPLTVVSNIQQNVTLRFYTLAHVKHGGFLIKYSVLPVSNNGTVRLQCYVAPAVNRTPVSTNFPIPNLSKQPSLHISNMNNEMNVPIDQERRVGGGEREDIPLSSLGVTHSSDLIKRYPSDHDIAPPILGTLEEHKDIMSLAGVDKQQQQLQGLNQSLYKRYLFPNSSSFRRSNMTLIVICVVTGVIFLLIMINALIWFIFSLRPTRSKSTTSCQNLYPRPATLSSETKTTTSNYPTPLHPRRHHSQSSLHLDDSSIMSNHLVRRDRILPQAAASNRLKTLRSLLFRGHKTLGIDSMISNNRYHHNRDIDSTSSEYPIRSLSQSLDEPQLPKSRYEEQEDFVELKSECSFLTNHNHGLLNKTKSNQEPRQINSWDDI